MYNSSNAWNNLIWFLLAAGFVLGLIVWGGTRLYDYYLVDHVVRTDALLIPTLEITKYVVDDQIVADTVYVYKLP